MDNNNFLFMCDKSGGFRVVGAIFVVALALSFIMAGCASTGAVWDRIDGKLVLVKYWKIKGPQITSYEPDKFQTDSKQTGLLDGLVKANDVGVVK